MKKTQSIFLLILMVFSSSIFAQNNKKSEKKKPPEIDFEFSFTTMYDDNILKYSEKYLDRFMNNEDEGRFHIDTYDDVILTPSFDMGTSLDIFKKVKTNLDFGYKYNAYVVNPIKDWQSINIGIRQYLNKKMYFGFSYSYIPEFYVRHFRDDDYTEHIGYVPEAFTPYIFSKDNYEFYFQNTFFKNTRIRFYFYYAKYFHNASYTEYDSDNLVYRFKVWQPLSKKLTFEFSYQYTTSDARGYDEPFETLSNSDDSDATYEEDGYIAGITWKLPKVKKKYHTLEFETLIYNRYYQTVEPVQIDPLHAGRVDNNLRFYFTYYLSLYKKFKVYARYQWFYRDSGTTSDYNEEFVSDEKDYVQNRVSLEFVYKF